MTRWLRLVAAATLALASPLVPTADAASDTAAGTHSERAGLETSSLSLARGQIARLKAFGLDSRFGPVVLRLLIKSTSGQVLASRDLTLAPGQSVELELPHADLPPGTRRVRVHGVVERLTTPPGGECPLLRASLDVRSAQSGQVLVAVSAGPACPIPSSEPAPPIGPQ